MQLVVTMAVSREMGLLLTSAGAIFLGPKNTLKRYFYFLHTAVELTAMKTSFQSKEIKTKLPSCLHVFWIWSFHVAVLPKTAEEYTKM